MGEANNRGKQTNATKRQSIVILNYVSRIQNGSSSWLRYIQRPSTMYVKTLLDFDYT